MCENMEFEIDDIVEQNGHSDALFRVSGVIHDDQRLFVTDDSGRFGDGREFEIHFNEVTAQFRKVTTEHSANTE